MTPPVGLGFDGLEFETGCVLCVFSEDVEK